MSKKTNALKLAIIIPWLSSLAFAWFTPGESIFDIKTINRLTGNATDSVSYEKLLITFLKELEKEQHNIKLFDDAFRKKDTETTDKILAILGSKLDEPQLKGLYYLMLGAYYKITPKRYDNQTQLASEFFFLGSLHCQDNTVGPLCKNLLKKHKLPQLAELPNNVEEIRAQKIIKDHYFLQQRDDLSGLDELFFHFPALSLCKYLTENPFTNRQKVSDKLESDDIEVDSQQKSMNEHRSKEIGQTTHIREKPKTAEEQYSQIPDYQPNPNDIRQEEKLISISKRDLIDDQKKRYDNLHKNIVNLFETSAHDQNIYPECYKISSSRLNSSAIGLKITLVVIENNGDCMLNNKLTKKLVACLIGTLTQHEKITNTKFKSNNTTISFSYPQEQINGTSLVGKLERFGIPMTKEGIFKIEITSEEFYSDELNKLNKKIQDYHKFQNKD